MRLVNAGIYSLGWLLCVWSGAHHLTLLPVLVVLLFVALQLAYQAYLSKESYYQDLLLVGYATLTGTLMETLFIATGLLQYTTPSAFFWWFPPAWIIGLYPLFALTFNHSLKPFTSRWPLLICIGAVGGPLSYWAGKKLGAVTFEASPAATFSLLALA